MSDKQDLATVDLDALSDAEVISLFSEQRNDPGFVDALMEQVRQNALQQMQAEDDMPEEVVAQVAQLIESHMREWVLEIRTMLQTLAMSIYTVDEIRASLTFRQQHPSFEQKSQEFALKIGGELTASMVQMWERIEPELDALLEESFPDEMPLPPSLVSGTGMWNH